MKKNRSNTFTRGLVVTNDSNDDRFCFFELDRPFSREDYEQVRTAYRTFGLDLVTHRTGNGIHFLSPTLVSKAVWKKFHQELAHLNPKCPMTTLRIEPNKYPNEAEIWYSSSFWDSLNRYRSNSIELCNLLKKWFKPEALEPRGANQGIYLDNWVGTVNTKLKFVRYPLPMEIPA